jgi:RNA polymerase primary sigma factor
LHQRYQRPPTDRELSAALSWPLHVVEQTRQEHHVIGWLHDSTDDDNFRFDDIVQDDQVSRPDEDIARLQLQQCVVDSLDTLPKRDAQILRLRFGLGTDRAYTLQEIGEQMGLSRERIRQIEKAALEKLRLSAAGASLAEAAGIAAS